MRTIDADSLKAKFISTEKDTAVWRAVCNVVNCLIDDEPTVCDEGRGEWKRGSWQKKNNDKEHPVKTRLDDFIEKHPNARIGDDGTPFSCAGFCGYTLRDSAICDKRSCSSCWNEQVDE